MTMWNFIEIYWLEVLLNWALVSSSIFYINYINSSSIERYEPWNGDKNSLEGNLKLKTASLFSFCVYYIKILFELTKGKFPKVIFRAWNFSWQVSRSSGLNESYLKRGLPSLSLYQRTKLTLSPALEGVMSQGRLVNIPLTDVTWVTGTATERKNII